VNFLLAAEGLPAMPAAEVARCVGEGVATLIARVFTARENAAPIQAVVDRGRAERAKDPAAVLRERVEKFRAHYAEHLLDRTQLFAGVQSFLAQVRAAVLTNKPEAMSRRILDGLGVGARIEVVIGGDTLPTRKPDPAGCLEILARCRVPASRGVLIGDSVVDAQTARAAQVRFVGVSYGSSARDDDIAAGAIGVVDSLEEIAC
jgi:phosphoglycolate phosphatase